MKQMIIERSLQVNGILSAEQVRLQCQLKYQEEMDGKRALGNIYVRGIYYDGEKKRPLREVIALDVFAPKYKLMDSEEFLVELKDSHYTIDSEAILLTIELSVYGVVSDDEPVDMVPLEIDFNTDETTMYYDYDEKPIEIIEEINEKIINDVEIVEDDIFYQKESKQKYRMIVLKENSSYEILAGKYGVDIYRLKKINNDKLLVNGMIVFLPENES